MKCLRDGVTALATGQGVHLGPILQPLFQTLSVGEGGEKHSFHRTLTKKRMHEHIVSDYLHVLSRMPTLRLIKCLEVNM